MNHNLEKEAFLIEQEKRKNDLLKIYDGHDKVISSEEALKSINEENKADREIFLTKITKLDNIIGGFRGGQIIVISAPTGQGKTIFLQDLTRKFFEQNTNCLWFNFEVGLEEFFERFCGNIPNFYLPKRLNTSSIEWLKERIKESILKYNTKIVFIDHLHYLLSMEDLSRVNNTSLFIGTIMRELKKIAIDCDIVIFLVSHMKMTTLQKTPSIEDLRDSSFVGQESDIVLMLWRHKQKDPESITGYSNTNESRLIVEKNRRTGKTGWIRMVLTDGKFLEIDQTHEQ